LNSGWSRADKAAPWDFILAETDSFVVVPSVGALVPGWLLAIPRRPVLAIGELDESTINELEELKSRLCRLVEKVFGPPAAFEHGPAQSGLGIGCSVDHAHLHVLPAPCSLTAADETTLEMTPDWQNAHSLISTREYFSAGISYLYVEQPLGERRIADAAHMPSQFFRRRVAQHIGVAGEFDWRRYPKTDNVVATIDALKARL
jgi:diadenosine tetraphosphate (Ap4A) HIT family hydrolase